MSVHKFYKKIAGRRGSLSQRFFVIVASAAMTVSSVQGQNTQPLVAIHDSELTRALETLPAVSPTPTNAGTTGFQWWTKDWHYFVMPDSLKEAFRSDGTAFTVIGDSNITAGALLNNGVPQYPIVITLASEAMTDAEIAPLTNYVAAGGFLFIGGSAFTRQPNGTSRGDFALAAQMGVHMSVAGVTNWAANSNFTRISDHRLVSHIPEGQLTWRMPSSSEEINWGISPAHLFLAPHDLWQVQATDATVIAQGDSHPYITVKQYGKGYVIYDAAFDPLVGSGGFAPGMYAYVIVRKAVEWAFESAKLPVPKLSPWPYQYNAAFMIRHDLEDFTNEVADLELSAGFEFTNGVTGDYYFCTGTLRQDMVGLYDTNAVVQSLRRAMTNYGATIGPHNGGLKNPNNANLVETNYDYWHWGPDEALDATFTNYPSGLAYATVSLSNAFTDIESWLPGLMTTNMRVWTTPNFNATRENSYMLQQQLGVKIAGDQKITPFPHWTLSTQTPDMHYSFLSEPVSDWFVNGLVAQSMEPWHPPGVHTPATVQTAVDYYYSLGALINLYSHTLSTGEGDAGQLVPQYITYSMNTNLHPRLWSANAISVYQWWLQRSNAQISVNSFFTNDNQCVTSFDITGASDDNTSVEMLLPAAGTVTGIQVQANGDDADSDSYRIVGQTFKVLVGTSVTNVVVTYSYGPGAQSDFYNVYPGTTLTINAPGVLGNDVPGLGSTNLTASLATDASNGTVALNEDGSFTYTPNPGFTGVDSFTYVAFDGLTESAPATVTVEVMPSGNVFYDNFTRSAGSDPLSPWQQESGTWGITNGVLRGSSAIQTYGYAYVPNNLTDCSIQASVAFPVGAFGGGIGGHLNAATGAHYGAWIFPEGSVGGSNVLKLIKYQSWTNWSGIPMQQVNIPGVVGTNFHTLKLSFSGNQISVFLDGTQMINVTDASSPYTNGGISADMWTYGSPYTMQIDNVSVLATPKTPVAANDNYVALENTLLQVAASGVLSNDFGGVGPLNALLVDSPAHGTLNFTNNGSFSYLPDDGFVGSDSFTYQATDGQSTSTVATVSITVNGTNVPPVAANNFYTFQKNLPLIVSAPGILGNDTDANGDSLTAILVTTTTNGTLTLNADGSFTYVPATDFGETDTFTYRVSDGQTTSAVATVTLSDPTAGIYYSDDFSRTNGLLAPWIAYSNNWVVTNGTLRCGTNPLQTYAFAYVGTNWTNYSVQGRVQFSTNAAFGGGIGGCLNPLTGAHYAAWIYPEASPQGGPMMNIVKFNDWANWGYNNIAFLPMATKTGLAGGVGTNFHTIKMAFFANQVAAYYDGVQVISVIDTQNPYLSGGITADMWTDLIPDFFSVDDVVVSPLVTDDSYTLTANTSLTVPAPGVLGNDTAVYSTNLQAQLINSPTNGTLTLNTNGGFLYTPASNYFGTDSFSYRAIDGATNLGIATATITINGSHNGPSLAQNLSNVTITVQTPLLITNVATDNDIPPWGLNYTLVSPPAGATINSNGVITWSPSYAQSPSTNTITTVVTDTAPLSLSATNTFKVFVNEVNIAPVLPSQADRTINELVTLTVTNTATEANSNATIVTYTLVSPQQGMNIDSNGIFTWKPAQTQSPSTNTVAVIVVNSDPLDTVNPVLTAQNSFRVFVREVNVAPTFTFVTPQTVNELQLLTVTNVVTETNIHAVTTGFGLVGALPGMSITNTGVFTWTPSQTQSPGNYTVTVVATNNDVFDTNNPVLTATNTFTVAVKEVNVAPVPAVISPQTVNELVQLSVNNAATEPNIHSATTGYGLISPLQGMNVTSAGLFTWTPSQTQSPTNVTVTIVVTNNNAFDLVNPVLKATNSFTVAVKEINVAPTFTLISTQFVNELNPIAVVSTATESNIHATITGYGLIGAQTNMSVDSNGIFHWTPSQAQSHSTNTIMVVATNSDPLDLVNPVLVATNTFVVVVREVNVAPQLVDLSDQTVNELTPLIVTNIATEANINAVNAGFGLISPLSGMNMSSNGVFTWTPSQAQSHSTNTVTVVVTNSDVFDLVNPKLTATNSFRVVVKEVNQPPTLPIIGPQTVNEQIQLSVNDAATETNINSITTGYVLINGLLGMNISSNGLFTWTPSQSQSPTNVTVTVVVSNSNAFDTNNPVLMATNSFTVGVHEVNIAPIVAQIDPQTVNELQPLTVTNFATEPNIHATITGYGLAGGLQGMNVDSNGVFTWTPSQTQSPSSNLVSVVVTNSDPLDLVNPVLTTTNTFTVKVIEINVAPVLLSAGPQTVNELVQLSVQQTVTETNIHAATTGFGLINALSGMNITSNGLFTWTPSQLQSPTNVTVTVVATNTDVFDLVNPHLTATNSFTVAVKEVNIAPQFPNIPMQFVNEQIPMNLSVAVTESNIHAVTIGYALINPLTGMNVNSNGLFTWTPTQDQSPSTNFVTVVAINRDVLDPVNTQLTASTTFTVVVNEVNIAPLVAPISLQTVNELQPLTVTNFVTEPNIHAVTTGFGLIGGLTGMNVDSNGVFTWTPSQTQSHSTNLVTVVVTNSDAFDTVNPILKATNTFNVVVKEVNQPPTPAVIAPQTVNELVQLSVNDAATETNINSITTGYTIINPLQGMNVTSNGLFTWTPAQTQSPTNTTVTIVVANTNQFDTNNSVLTATNSFTVAVKEVNVAPTMPIIGPQTVNEQIQLTVNDAATETNIHSVITGYGIISPLQGMNITSGGLFTWTPSQSQSPGNYTITVVATNNNAFDTVNPVLTATNSFSVAVKEVNIVPVVTPIGLQTVNELQPLTVTNFVTEPNIHAVTTGFGLVGALTGMNVDSNGVFTWTPSQTQSHSTNLVTIVVTNSDTFDTVNPILTTANTFNVVVKEINQPPTLPIINPQTVNELVQLSVNDAATETNINSVTTGYGIVSPLLGMNVTSNGLFTWTPSQSQSPGNYTITIVATNNNAFDTVNPTLTASNSFTVAVKEVNVAPTMPIIGPQTVNEQIQLTVNDAATETNIHSVITGYGIISPLQGMNITSVGLFTWTPSQSQSPGNYTITIVATNNNAFDTINPILTATNSFTVAVKEVNIAPSVAPIGLQTVNELQPLTVTNFVTEPNIHAVTTGFGLIGGLTGMNVDSNGVFTWTPSQTQSHSTNLVTVVVTNSDAFDTVNPILTTANTFNVVVKEVNQPPTPAVIAPQTVNELVQLTVNNAATETNINSITTGYTIVNPLLGMNVTSNGLFTWAPGQTQSPTNTTVTIVVANTNQFDTNNPVLTATNSFTVAVKEVNVAPTMPIIGPQTANEQVQLTVNDAATETNIHSVITGYGIISPLSGMNVTSNGLFTWTPSQTQSPGNYTITIVATNNNAFDTINPVLTATNSFTVAVKEVNVAPTMPIIGPQTVNEQIQLTVNDAATETNIHSVITGYTIVSPLLGMNITSAGLFTWTPSQSQSPGNYTITIVAANSNQFDTINPVLTATNSFTVAVKEVNIAPLVTPIGLQTVNELQPLTVTNIVTEPNIHAVTTGFGLVGALSGMNVDSNGVFTWTPSQLQSHSTNLVTVVVTNSDTFDTVNPILTTANTFNVVVKEVNQPPTLPLIGPQTLAVGNPLTVTNTATETNINAVTTGYALVGAPSGALISSNGVITWTPQTPGTVTLTTVVTNNDVFDLANPILTATNSFQVLVTPIDSNAPPVIQPIGLSNGVITITWSSVIGQTYQVQYKNDLAATNWQTLTNMVASNTVSTAADAMGNPQRFYRVVKLAVINTAPVLPGQSNVTITLGATLTITNAATDAESNSFAYYLTNSPSGATISSNGVITWTPQATGTNVITTVVTDDGLPPLSAINSFQVVVNPSTNVPPPAIQSIALSNNVIIIIWSSVVGQSYQVQYKSDIAATNWQNLGTAILASNTVSSTTDPIINQSRFYRVMLVVASNPPPVLPPQSDVTLHALSTLTVTNTATEPGTNTFSYQLVTPPYGATISSNGIITWTPQMAGSNIIMTIVTDSGQPQLSATNSFNVTVANPVSLQAVSILASNAIVTWSSLSNHNYRVQYKTDLSATNWTTVTPDVQASGATVSATNAVGSDPQRFYRVLVLQ